MTEAFLRRLDQIVKNRIADSDPEAIEAASDT